MCYYKTLQGPPKPDLGVKSQREVAPLTPVDVSLGNNGPCHGFRRDLDE